MKEPVTGVQISEVDDRDVAAVTRCLCGQTYPAWQETLSIYEDNPWECPKCGVKLVFGYVVTVYQVVDGS